MIWSSTTSSSTDLVYESWRLPELGDLTLTTLPNAMLGDVQSEIQHRSLLIHRCCGETTTIDVSLATESICADHSRIFVL